MERLQMAARATSSRIYYPSMRSMGVARFHHQAGGIVLVGSRDLAQFLWRAIV